MPFRMKGMLFKNQKSVGWLNFSANQFVTNMGHALFLKLNPKCQEQIAIEELFSKRKFPECTGILYSEILRSRSSVQGSWNYVAIETQTNTDGMAVEVWIAMYNFCWSW